MSADPSRREPRHARPPLSLPLVALLGVMTMGSGLGNSGGCGPSNYSSESPPYVPPVCDDGCDALAGTYQVSYKDKTPVDAGCAAIGMKLPTEWVIERQGDKPVLWVNGRSIQGTYYSDEKPLEIYFGEEYESVSADGQRHTLRFIVAGDVPTMPTSAQQSATFTGDVYHYRVGNAAEPASTIQCSFDRVFTATRKGL